MCNWPLVRQNGDFATYVKSSNWMSIVWLSQGLGFGARIYGGRARARDPKTRFDRFYKVDDARNTRGDGSRTDDTADGCATCAVGSTMVLFCLFLMETNRSGRSPWCDIITCSRVARVCGATTGAGVLCPRYATSGSGPIAAV